MSEQETFKCRTPGCNRVTFLSYCPVCLKKLRKELETYFQKEEQRGKK